jgi:hypothetical protein
MPDLCIATVDEVELDVMGANGQYIAAHLVPRSMARWQLTVEFQGNITEAMQVASVLFPGWQVWRQETLRPSWPERIPRCVVIMLGGKDRWNERFQFTR